MLRIPVIIKAVDHQFSRNLMVNEWIGINGVFSQTIRWKRKPIWLPTAKSKMFKVPPRLRLPAEESVEILRLYNHYRTYRKSIREFLIDEMKASQVQFDEASLKKAEEKDYMECMKINEQWNKEIAEVRNLRLEKQQAMIKSQVVQAKKDKEKREKEAILQIEEKVRKVKKEAETFITRENIDQVIEETLANIVNYNAAIDVNGNRITDQSSDTKSEMTASQS